MLSFSVMGIYFFLLYLSLFKFKVQAHDGELTHVAWKNVKMLNLDSKWKNYYLLTYIKLTVWKNMSLWISIQYLK